MAIKLPKKFFPYICRRVALDTGMCASKKQFTN